MSGGKRFLIGFLAIPVMLVFVFLFALPAFVLNALIGGAGFLLGLVLSISILSGLLAAASGEWDR